MGEGSPWKIRECRIEGAHGNREEGVEGGSWKRDREGEGWMGGGREGGRCLEKSEGCAMVVR